MPKTYRDLVKANVEPFCYDPRRVTAYFNRELTKRGVTIALFTDHMSHWLGVCYDTFILDLPFTGKVQVYMNHDADFDTLAQIALQDEMKMRMFMSNKS